MTRTTLDNIARPGRFTAAVVKKTDLSRRYYLLVLERPAGFAEPEPGTFIHLLPPGPGRFFLRRPFSILDCDESTVSLLIVEKGAGTAYLRSMPEGAAVDFIGPLGNSFPRLPGKRILAIGGGVGLAPLYLLPLGAGRIEARRRVSSSLRRSDKGRPFHRTVRLAVHRTSGSRPTTEATVSRGASSISPRARWRRSSYDAIFSCGPMPMIAAADRLAKKKAVRHYVSLENRMGCGMGACRSCVVPVREAGVEKYRTVCNDGPVFDANDLVWDKLPAV